MDDYLNRLESDWANTNHPEERRAIYNLAAHYCQTVLGQRLEKTADGKWKPANSKR